MNQGAVSLSQHECAASSGKRQAIITGATEVFLRHGYGAASMEAIAQQAGVSKQTIYAHFDGKDALFEAIIRQKCDEALSPALVGRRDDETVEDVLVRIADGFVHRVLNRENVRLFRIIISESVRFSELAEGFYRSGPRLAADQLAGFLSEAAAAGEIAVSDARKSAEMFFATLRGDIYMRRLLDIDGAFDEAEATAYARRVVNNFLHLHMV